ncbi:HigA family addiction module antitoxin [Corynebacterium macclintockiae]|uniref:HigA family addiction module antitoxin n=1 Tax=Corynebacterium macclintockiae TaxID=2913501 RepID=UPI003EBDE0AE
MTYASLPQTASSLDAVPVPHPGEILFAEFLQPLGITQYRLAKEIRTTDSQISKLVRGSIGVGADMALRLSAFFGNSAEFWLGLQEDYDLWHARQTTDTSHITAWHR